MFFLKSCHQKAVNVQSAQRTGLNYFLATLHDNRTNRQWLVHLRGYREVQQHAQSPVLKLKMLAAWLAITEGFATVPPLEMFILDQLLDACVGAS